MNIRKIVAVLLVGAIALASILGVAAYTIARAQEGTPSANPEATTPGITTMEKGFFHGGHGLPGGVDNEELAAALGITVDQLNTAYQNAFNAGIDQAVAKGLITQAQADELRSNGSAFPFGGRWSGWLSQNGIDYNALLADALKISVEELQAAKDKAYNARIDQAVTDGYLTQEQADLLKGEYALRNNDSFQSSMKSAFEAAVNQAVSAGVITQAQADAILSKLNTSGSRIWLGGPGMEGPGFGGHGGRGGGHHGGWEGFPGGQTPNTAPQQTQPSGTNSL